MIDDGRADGRSSEKDLLKVYQKEISPKIVEGVFKALKTRGFSVPAIDS